jgi:alcohol dehydrogenase class IV
MRPLTIYQPKKLSFGENVYMQIADDLEQMGFHRLFVVTGHFMLSKLVHSPMSCRLKE